MAAAYVVSLACIALVCLVGVLNTRYHDTLGQRIGMGVTCLGAIAELYALQDGTCRDNAAMLTSCGVAIFAVATLFKKLGRARVSA